MVDLSTFVNLPDKVQVAASASNSQYRIGYNLFDNIFFTYYKFNDLFFSDIIYTKNLILDGYDALVLRASWEDVLDGKNSSSKLLSSALLLVALGFISFIF